MTPVQRRRFSPPPARGPQNSREVHLGVSGGFHGGLPPQMVPPGFSPDLRNYTPREDGYVTPRSGLSQFGSHDFNGAVLGAFRTFDVSGAHAGVALSALSVSFIHRDSQVWSDVSYVAGNQSWQQGVLSGSSAKYFRGATVYDDALQKMIFVFTNDNDSVKFMPVETSTATFSDFTWADSISSTKLARDVTSIDDRLILFNVQDAGGSRFPSRVVYSARGAPRDFLIANGGGAEDLVDMQGEGEAAVRFREYVLLFTEYELWTAFPTRDDYAFRFSRVKDAVGTPWPRTIAVAPDGVVFLGRDREVYITDGSGIRALGPVEGSGPSRIQTRLKNEAINLDKAWGIYNQDRNRYELYYPISGSPNGWPSRALFYSFEDQTWWPQTYGIGLSAGEDFVDVTAGTTWADFSAETWGSVTSTWGSFNVNEGLRHLNVFESNGTVLRSFSSQTDDDGTAIDVRWRSPGLRHGTRQGHLKELWVDYEINSNSSATVWLGSSRSGDAFTADKALSLTTNGAPLFVPVWKTDQFPMFELRLNDGGQPRIASFTATLQDASKF